MKAGKTISAGGMELSSGEIILELDTDVTYTDVKYFGFLKVNYLMQTEMTDKMWKQYYGKIRK